jgi:hypothetical protein
MKTMIERLARALEHIDELSPEAQEELAQQIEELAASPDAGFPQPALRPGEEHLPERVRRSLAAIGIARDQQDVDEFEALDRIRHSSPPSPPLDLGDL